MKKRVNFVTLPPRYVAPPVQILEKLKEMFINDDLKIQKQPLIR